ncbi:hypothetical protein [Paenibacillus tengchongensis]|uniref:hypothetical protein n=1 Tax=Paenibacillus tengchongensis TaxID=2608684 RepID=UPI00124E8A07|nr:hypothetical protein [Paenibacillus tengchongensis]
MNYYGIIIEESLNNPAVLSEFTIAAHKQQGGWGFKLVSVSEDELARLIQRLQQHMIPVSEDCWYNHFFAGERLVVVYQNQVFYTTVNAEDWTEVIQYGMRHGIPREQLDFNPCRQEAAVELFRI